MKKSGKTIEERFQKLDDVEHVLVRPDMYIGNTKETTRNMWIYNLEDTGPKIINKEITFIPGFYKTFDEIIVNAADETKRTPKCNHIKVSIDQEDSKICVWNNGLGIPVEKHKEFDMWVPEMIFGNLRAGENFDDDEEKVVGGRNGLGAKLANIYSLEFIVENCDGKKNFKQVFKKNMSIKGKPSVKDAKKNPYTQITFIPDLEKFKMNKISDDVFALFKKRVFDIAMTTGAKVSFNGETITPLSFTNYINLFFPEGSDHKKVIDIATHARWKVGIVFDPTDQIEHQNISFVNSICTNNGGSHVEHVSGQIVKKLQEIIHKKSKMNVKPILIKENLIFFVDSTIVNPEFDGQSKDALTLKAADFGSKFIVSDALIKKIVNTGVVEKIIMNAKMKEEGQVMKNVGKGSLHHITDLYDAANAGKKGKSQNCILCLTEGKSAKGFAMRGFNEVGRDDWGVFPLRGKLKNVRGKSIVEISKNEEIEAIRVIMGLVPGKVYNDVSELRYGKIAILTDQDSVTGDTPLLLKNINNQIDICTIDNIANEWVTNITGKEYSHCDHLIWTDIGWTKIVKIIRHKVTKPIYRVLTHTGIVDVTEDHSLLTMDGDKISPNDCKVGDLLLHSFPNFDDTKIDIPDDLEKLSSTKLWKYASSLNIQYSNTFEREDLIEEIKKINGTESLTLNSDFGINSDEAYLMGFFWADGTCGIYKFKVTGKNYFRTSYNWSIVNMNMDFLIKSKEILLKYYDYDVSIVTCNQNNPNGYSTKQIYKLIVNGGKKIEPLVEKYRSLFYDKDKKKRIPLEILNASYDVRSNFLAGYYSGDGRGHDINDTSKPKTVAVDGKIGAHGIFFLCRSLGYQVSINHDIKKPKVYHLYIAKGTQNKNQNVIKKIFNLGVTEQYVYDLETENHHFQGGIGQAIISNTDGSHIKGLIMNYIHSQWPSLLKNVKNFLICISTPIVKATKKGKKKEVICFKTLNDFEEWKKENNDGNGWDIKYYKGLGTSESHEAREVFENLDENITYYFWDPDTKKIIPGYEPKMKDCCEDAMTLGFAKGRENDRKDWINCYDPSIYLDAKNHNISYAEFVHKELIAFSSYSVSRAIPHLMDGFKPGQRKIFYGCLKKNLFSK